MLQNKIAYCGVFFLVCIFPLFITDSYHNITFSKYFFFCVISSFFFAACLIAKIKNTQRFRLGKTLLNSVSAADISIFLFTAVAFLSALLSDYPLAALSGGGGRYMGLVMILALLFAYCFISRFYILTENSFMVFGVCFAFMCLFSFSQFLGFDFLNLLSGVAESQKYKFIGFIGNINVFSSYISLFLPIYMYLFCYTVDTVKRVCCFLVSVLGFIGLIISNSDSGYLGIAVAFIILMFMTLSDKKLFTHCLALVVAFSASAGIVSVMRNLFIGNARALSALGITVTGKYFIAAVAICSFLLMFIVNKISDRLFIYGRKVFVIMLLLVITAGISLFVYFSFINREVNIGKFESYLRFSDSWASDRAGIWMRVSETFKRLPLHQKLFGTGPDTLAFAVVDNLGTQAFATLGFSFDNAHNDILQYLVTLGVWGVLLYVFLVLSAVMDCVKSEDRIKKILLICISSYFAQSMFCITQPIVTPLFFVFIAFSQSKIRAEN